MMCLWSFVIFISAVAATGYCLECVTCSDFNSDSCRFLVTTAQCPDGNVCASRYRISVIGREFITQFFDRFCAQPSECKATGTFRKSINSLERMATTCCSENLCTPTKPIAPEESSEPNGLQCPTCSLLSFGSCGNLESMDCMGDQTMCLLVTKKQTTGSQTLTSIDRGCASEGFCYKSNETSTAGTVYTETTYSCNGGSAANTATTTKNTATATEKTLLLSVLPVIVVLMQ